MTFAWGDICLDTNVASIYVQEPMSHWGVLWIKVSLGGLSPILTSCFLKACRNIQISLLSMWVSSFSCNTCWRDTLLLYTGTFYVVNSLTIGAWVYFWAHVWGLYSIPLSPMSVTVPVPCCLQFGLKSRRVVASTLVFFFPPRLLWPCWVLCGSLWILGIFVLVWEKGHGCFPRDCLQSVDCFRQYGHLHHSSSTRACDIFVFLCVIFHCLSQCFSFQNSSLSPMSQFYLRYLILFMGLVLAFFLIGL